MTANIGTTDKILRIILGLIIIALGIVYSSWWGLIGVVPILTALINYCPAYSLINFSTNKKNSNRKN